VTIDIAHHGQTVETALEALSAAIATHRQGATQFLRVIVGGGRIRLAALKRLTAMQSRGTVVRFGHEEKNQGSVIVVLK